MVIPATIVLESRRKRMKVGMTTRVKAANSATQSPKLDTTPAHHRRANGPRRTRLNGREFWDGPSTMGDHNTVLST